MFSHLFRLATLAKGAVAISLVAGAYSTAAANVDLPESAYHSRTATAVQRGEKTAEPTAKPAGTTKPEDTKKPEETKRREPAKKTAEPGSPTTTTGELDPLVKECLAWYAKAMERKEKDNPGEDFEVAARHAREACDRAIASSGLTREQFWAKYRPLLETRKPVTKPETKPTADVEALVKECARLYAAVLALKDASTETHEAAGRKASEACKAAIAASGLSADEFWAKYRSLFEQLRTKPTEKPTTTKPIVDIEPLVKECAHLYAAAIALKDASPETREAAGRKASEACKAAIAASGLSADAFWAKYRSLFEHRRPVSKPTEKPATTKPTEKPATVAKPTAEFEQLLKDCVSLYAAAVALKDASPETREAAGRKASEACKAAIAASGLGTDAFWVKYKQLFAHEN